MNRIERLSQDVINQIAAGEVVQRPSAALKELLENSLDAGATSINVTAADGGLEVLQVADDGCGVRHEDLSLLCERYATSKLRAFEELTRIGSFGFRGEALASLSYVSRVTVTTMRRSELNDDFQISDASETRAKKQTGGTNGAAVAWRCRYVDGQLMGPPQACAGNPGTIVRAEQMFYKASVRRAALRSSEEWSRVVNVVSRYALAFPAVGFSCQREGSGGGALTQGVAFPKASTTLANIRVSQGNTVASRLRFIYHYHAAPCAEANGDGDRNDHHYSDSGGCGEDSLLRSSASSSVCRQVNASGNDPQRKREQLQHQERTLAAIEADARRVRTLSGPAGAGVFTISGYTSDPTLPNRKPYLCLFINHRLVESTAVHRAVDAAYAGILTGGNRPFTVLFLVVPADRIDVNVHPTKKEVCLLDEELVLARMTELVRAALLRAAEDRQLDSVRVAAAVALSRGPGGAVAFSAPTGTLHSQSARGSLSAAVTVAPSTIVRVEPQKGALDAFLRPKGSMSSSTPMTTFTYSRKPDSGKGDKDAVTEEDVKEEKLSEAPACAWNAVLASVKAIKDYEEEDNVGRDVPKVAALVINTEKDAARDVESSGGATISRSGESDDDTATVMADFKRYRLDLSNTTAAASGDGNGDVASALRASSQGISIQLSKPEAAVARGFDTIAEYLQAEREAEELSSSRVKQEDAIVRVDSDGDDERESSIGGKDASTTLLPELEDRVLTSVGLIVEEVHAASSATARAFVDGLSLIGVVDTKCFLAQSGTSLYLIDTLATAQVVVFQRIFLRWVAPGLPRQPALLFKDPQKPLIKDLLYAALKHDAVGMRPPSAALLNELRMAHRARHDHAIFSELPSDEDLLSQAGSLLFLPSSAGGEPIPATRRYVSRLCRVLGRWRDMLQEYFGIYISTDRRRLEAVPHVLSPSWPPLLRAVPLFMWMLADAVPFPGMDTCAFADTTMENGQSSSQLLQQQPSQSFEAEASLSDSALSAGTTSAAEAEDNVRAEIACFTSIASHIASVLYGIPHKSWQVEQKKDDDGKEDAATCGGNSGNAPALVEAIQFGLFPALKSKQFFVAPARMLVDGSVQAVVSVESLYKVFERC